MTMELDDHGPWTMDDGPWSWTMELDKKDESNIEKYHRFYVGATLVVALTFISAISYFLGRPAKIRRRAGTRPAPTWLP